MRTILVNERKKAGYSQESFAVLLGISRSHYSQIETGDKAPSLALGIKIKQKLLHKSDDIFFNNSSPILRHNQNVSRGTQPKKG